MPEKEQQDKSLSELVVKEAVGVGMDSPMRDSILEAVEEAEGSSRKPPALPLAGALFGLGTAIGYLLGRESPSLEETSLEDVQEPEIIEDVMEETEDQAESILESETEEAEAESTSRRLPRVLLALGALAGAAFLRRRLAGDEEAEWEPIEEFEPATSEDEEEEEEAEEASAEADEGGDEEEEE